MIVDLAVEAGGNCPLSEYGKVVTKHDVTLIGHANVPSRLAETTSQLFARNLLNFLTPMIDKDTGKMKIDREDAVIQGTLVCMDGEIVQDRVKEALGSGSSKQAAPKKAAAKKASKKSGPKKTGPKKAGTKKAAAKKAPAETQEAAAPAQTPANDSAGTDGKEG